jgi:pyrroline-5-carboxylate reductase
MIANLKVGFIGAGKMATALARGFMRAGLVESDAISASDVSPAALASFVREAGGRAMESNAAVADAAEVLFIAVKPAQVAGVLQEIAPHLSRRHLVVSIAAGVPLARLQAGVPEGTRVVRVMPNTPAVVGAAASAYALGAHATVADGELVQKLLAALGFACQVPESLLDAVTGLSGSGPAYIYLVIEALSDGGVAAGLPREVATRLAAQTVLGAARMVMETGQHPGVLKDQVTSPGGTTIEGLHELENAGVRAAFISAVRAATEKSRQLGNK